MKKACTIIGLGLVSFLSADYYSSCPNGNCGYQGQGYNQDQGHYYQGREQGQYYQDRGQGYVQEQYRQDRYNQQPQGQYYQENDSRNQPNTQYQRDQEQRHVDQGRDFRDNQNVSEQEIAKNVHDLLEAGVFSKGYPNVTFSIHRGDVTLSGSVDTQDDKNKIEDNVRKIKGVRQVNNQITLTGKQTSYNDSTYKESDSKVRDAEKNYPQDTASSESDKMLNARIREKISDGWFTQSYKMITLRTNNGVVTIIGVVDSNEDVKKINDKLRDVEGIRSVNNQLSTKAK